MIKLLSSLDDVSSLEALYTKSDVAWVTATPLRDVHEWTLARPVEHQHQRVSKRARGAAPLVNIWNTVYISETIRARKSKILQALG